jgi:hypothetical protein
MTTRTRIRSLEGLFLACTLFCVAASPRAPVRPNLVRPPLDYRDVAAVKSVRGLLSPFGDTVLAVVQEKDLAGNRILTRTWTITFSGADPWRGSSIERLLMVRPGAAHNRRVILLENLDQGPMISHEILGEIMPDQTHDVG